MVDIIYNKEAFLRKKPKNIFSLCIVFFMMFIFIFFLSAHFETYEHYLATGYVECDRVCHIVTLIPDSIPIEKIVLNRKEVTYTIQKKILQVNEIDHTRFYKLIIFIEDDLEDNQVVELNFYYDKQSILKKLI